MLTALAPVLPELWGGSADLGDSNNTTPAGQPSFLPAERQTKEFQGGPYGRVLHFGIREHAMGAIMNGIALHGGTRVYGGTFLVFSDYMRPAVRLAALMKLPVTYVWSHDSIGLGEDGPTHQPIEHLSSLRAIPGLDVVRPADANETAVAWKTHPRAHRPPGGAGADPAERADARPGQDAGRLARRLRARGRLRRPAEGAAARHRLGGADRAGGQGAAGGGGHADPRRVGARASSGSRSRTPPTRAQVLPPDVKARVSIEAGIAQCWWELLGDAGVPLSLEHFGASAPYSVLYEQFGLTAERAVASAHASLSKLGQTQGTTTGN